MRNLPLAALALVCSLAAGPASCADAAPPDGGRYLEVDGARLYVEVSGSGAPLVFLHGGVVYFDNAFAAQRDYFASFRTVIGIDRRGHGHSPDDARPFSYQAMADDMAAVIRQLGVGPVDVIGHSDGGNVGLILAHDHPELVRRLVVSGANLRSGLSAAEYERHRNGSAQQTEEAVHRLAQRLPPAFRPDYERVAPDARSASSATAAAARGDERWWTFLTKSYWLWLTPVVIATADLKAIEAPVLVMAGDHDFTPIEETLELFRNLPHGELFILPGTGHGTMQERPVLVNLAMREFLGRADATRPSR